MDLENPNLGGLYSGPPRLHDGPQKVRFCIIFEKKIQGFLGCSFVLFITFCTDKIGRFSEMPKNISRNIIDLIGKELTKFILNAIFDHNYNL